MILDSSNLYLLVLTFLRQKFHNPPESIYSKHTVFSVYSMPIFNYTGNIPCYPLLKEAQATSQIVAGEAPWSFRCPKLCHHGRDGGELLRLSWVKSSWNQGCWMEKYWGCWAPLLIISCNCIFMSMWDWEAVLLLFCFLQLLTKLFFILQSRVDVQIS